MRAKTTVVMGVFCGGVAALIGCGLIISDIATLTFQLPSKSFSFDTSSSMWKAPPGTFPAVPCGAGQLVTDCCQPPAPAPAPDCTATPLVCENSVCVLEFPVTVTQKIDLKMEVPALASSNGQSLASVSITQIQYTIASTLNVDLPPIQIFIAPESATTADDPNAKLFGTIPSTPAMTTRMGDVAIDPGGQAVFTQYAMQFGTPFNLIAHTTMVVAPGSPVPAGKVDVTVTGKVSAKPNL
jgi:hypothetical protein